MIVCQGLTDFLSPHVIEIKTKVGVLVFSVELCK